MMKPRSQTRPTVVPKQFRVSVGGFGGPNYELRLMNGRLRYQADFSSLPEKISPTAKEWETFWATVQRCDLWNWEARYDDFDICDGTQWAIEVMLGDRHLRSSGSNAYPGGEGTGYSKPFRLLLRAVRKLIGGRGFG